MWWIDSNSVCGGIEVSAWWQQVMAKIPIKQEEYTVIKAKPYEIHKVDAGVDEEDETVSKLKR